MDACYIMARGRGKLHLFASERRTVPHEGVAEVESVLPNVTSRGFAHLANERWLQQQRRDEDANID
jgi:hypothetical protein